LCTVKKGAINRDEKRILAESKICEILDMGDGACDGGRLLEKFEKEVGGAKQFLADAKGLLVFPSVIKAGVGFGGEFGEGALRISGKTVSYYNTMAGSFGLQLGAQAKTIVLVFLDEDALKQFRKSEGWKVGVDGSVAVIAIGAGTSLDSSKLNQPIVGFVLDQKGLMYNLTLEGSKFTRINK
jgi:lipid-binding SYLF domain-containing protein